MTDGFYSKEEFAALLDTLRPEDFDGHTDFDKLTPEQRLEWLSSCARFWFEVHGKKPE